MSRQQQRPGTPLVVTTNSFVIKQLPTKQFIQYAVEFLDFRDPDKPLGPRRAQEFMNRFQTHTAPDLFKRAVAVYDGKSIMYSSDDLGIPGGAEFSIFMNDAPPPNSQAASRPRRAIRIRITRVAGEVVDFSILRNLIKSGQSGMKHSAQSIVAINVLQLLIKQAPNLVHVHNARAYFTDVGRVKIGAGLELWQGYFQSVRPSIDRMLVNVDISMSAVYRSGYLADVALNVLGLDGGNARQLALEKTSEQFRRLVKFFKGVMITVEQTQPGRKKKIAGLVEFAGRYRFDKEGEGSMTVQEYYLQAYGITIAYPQMFGVLIQSKNMNMVIPAELCTVVPGQLYKHKVPESQTKEVVRFATKRPQDRLNTITSGVSADGAIMKSPILEYQNSPYIQKAGIVISQDPLQIDGRVLPTPQLKWGTSMENANDGAWNVLGKKFNHCSTIKVWTVIDFSKNTRARAGIAKEMMFQLLACMRELGMNLVIQPPQPRYSHAEFDAIFEEFHYKPQPNHFSVRALQDAVSQAIRSPWMQQLPPDQRPAPNSPSDLIIVIIPNNTADLRMKIKHAGDIELGWATQCVREDKINKPRLNQYLNNLALKINARLGGINFVPKNRILNTWAQQKTKYMIIGADVGHPGPGIKNQPSVSALVFSHDKDAIQYAALSRVQAPRMEEIVDLKEMMIEAVTGFAMKNNGPPLAIIFYRDGLSEGAFDTVGANEIKAIEEALIELWKMRNMPAATMPKLTFVAVGKRHHVRFFPRPGQGDRSGNCRAGFVSDIGLNSPIVHDFYLQSHGGLLGTSRPSHYIVLKDDNFRNDRDVIQELSFGLCHSFARATRSVSIPAPVYYADIVCARAKFHFGENVRFDDEGSVSSGSTDNFNLDHWRQAYQPIFGSFSKKMYFL